MTDEGKTERELLRELDDLRRRNAQLEAIVLQAKETEKRLRESEERLDLALRGADLGMWDYNLQTGDAFISERRAQMLGYAIDELEPTMSSWGSMVHPDDIVKVVKAFAAYEKGEVPLYECEHRLRCKSGEYIWVLARARVVERDAAGNPVRLVGTSLDITERKRAEEALRSAQEHLEQKVAERTEQLRKANEDLKREIDERKRTERDLRESERKYRLLAENVSDVIFVTDTRLRVTYVSPSVEKLHGWTAAEWRSFAPSDYLTPASLQLVLQVFSEELAAQENPGVDLNRVRTFEVEQYRKDGTTFWSEVSARFLYDDNGQLDGIIGVTRDITERKRSAEQLIRLFTAVEQAGETIFVTDASGTILYANPAFETTTGYSVSEAVGKTPAILKSGQQDEAFYRDMWDTLMAGSVWRGRLTNKRKDGSLYEETATISPIKDESGRIANFVAVKRDTTLETRLQTQLFQAQKMEAIGTLAGGIAHDFNNLLQAILGYSELLLTKEGPRELDRKKLEIIQAAAQDGADLVSRILTFCRKGESHKRPVHLNKEVLRVEKLLRRTLPRMIEIKLDLADSLHVIGADPAQIEQILLNLAINAQHAMPQGGRLVIETCDVTLSDTYARSQIGAEPGNYVLLAVSDNGRGMTPEVLERMFDPFFTTKPDGTGTGLGLAMVHGIIAQNGWYIRCYSEPDVGTSFQIYIPLSSAELMPSVEPPIQMPAFGTETILLVDDDARVRQMAREMIEMGGYKVIEAQSGEEALKIYTHHRQKIALVILDLNMPGMGGSFCLEELLRVDPNVRVLVATGYLANNPGTDKLQGGAMGLLLKPYELRGILAAIRRVLDQGHLQAT